MTKPLLFYGPFDALSRPLLEQFEAQGMTVEALAVSPLEVVNPASARQYFAERSFTTLFIYPGWTMRGAFLSSSAAEWQASLEALESLMYLLRAAAERLVALGGGGQLLLLSHLAALTPFQGLSRLGTMLGALRAFIKMMALELAPHRITVHGLALGPGLPGLPAAASARLRADTPFGASRPQETVALCKVLLTEAGRQLSGQTLLLDGGFLLTRGSVVSPYANALDEGADDG
jgi:NAD(P)-dependent dehydrogenase (short-subunit alcohol dehydrogenase family)